MLEAHTERRDERHRVSNEAPTRTRKQNAIEYDGYKRQIPPVLAFDCRIGEQRDGEQHVSTELVGVLLGTGNVHHDAIGNPISANSAGTDEQQHAHHKPNRHHGELAQLHISLFERETEREERNGNAELK